MYIEVIYQDNSRGAVKNASLDELIAQKKIKKFLRSDGWCTLGVDRIRTMEDPDYKGIERRTGKKRKSFARDCANETRKDTQEKRRYQRYYIYDPGIHIEMDCTNEIEVIDMSVGGISLKTDIKLQAGTQYILKMKIKDQLMTLRGDVRWSLLSEYKKYIVRNNLFPVFHNDLIPIYNVGMQFIKMSDRHLTEIIHFIDEHGIQDNDCGSMRDYYDLSELSEHLEGMVICKDQNPQVQLQAQEKSQDIRKKSIAEKRKAALFCGKEERAILLKDPNKEVVLSTIANPKITELEITGFAKMPTIPVEAINKIVRKREWMKNYAVVLALVNNPKTPAYISTRLVNRLKARDLRIIAKSREISETVRSIAKKRLYAS